MIDIDDIKEIEIDYNTDSFDYEVDNNELGDSYKLISKNKKQILKADLKKNNLKMICPDFRKQVETIHLITNSSYDLYNMVGYFIEKYGYIDLFAGSTWCMNAWNIKDIKEKYENKIIKDVILITGDYFKLKQRSEYGQLAEFMIKYKLKYKSCKNHAKILLLSHLDNYIVIESSANFTTNPRVENFCIFNDKEIFDFHLGWINDAINDYRVR